MDANDQQTTLTKWSKLIALTNAIERAKDSGNWVTRDSGKGHYAYTPKQACRIAHLKAQRRELRATMPIQVVS